MESIRLASIGTGSIVYTFLNHASNSDHITVEAVYSRNRSTGRELADRVHAKRVYTSLPELLSDDRINTVYIASPNILHFEQAKAVLLAGKHVICEKPLTPKASLASELASIAKERGLMLFEAAPTLHLPNYMLLKESLPLIGRIKKVESDYLQHSARYDLLKDGILTNIFDPKMAGGCLMDINYYNILLNVALFGSPDFVEYDPVFFPGAADVSGTVTMDYDFFASVNRASKAEDCFNHFTITGEAGRIIVINGSNGIEAVSLSDDSGEKILNDQPVKDRWYYEVGSIERIMMTDDFAAVSQLLDISIMTSDSLERARKSAGIIFPCD